MLCHEKGWKESLHSSDWTGNPKEKDTWGRNYRVGKEDDRGISVECTFRYILFSCIFQLYWGKTNIIKCTYLRCSFLRTLVYIYIYIYTPENITAIKIMNTAITPTVSNALSSLYTYMKPFEEAICPTHHGYSIHLFNLFSLWVSFWIEWVEYTTCGNHRVKEWDT